MFSPPSGDVTWGGVEARLYDGATLIDKVRSAASPPSVTLIVQNPDSSKTLTWKLVSFDVNGRTNSETAGTPQGTVLVGSTAGTLDLRRFLPTSTDNFAIVGSSLRIKTGVAVEVDGSGNLRVSVNGITSSLIDAGAVGVSQIVDGAITDLKLAADAVTAAKIAAGAVTSPAIAASAVTAGKIAALSITAGDIAADAITAAKILAGNITTVKIAAGAITANEIAANAIVAGKIAANAVSAVEIAANAITTGKILAGNVVAASIATNAVSSDKLDAISINVGGGGSKPGKFSVFNSFGSQVGFIGVESGFEGGWFKTFRVGGTSASNAKLIADASGNLSIVDATFSLTLNSVITEIANLSSGFTAGLRVKAQFGLNFVQVGTDTIAGKDSSGNQTFMLTGNGGAGETTLHLLSATSGNSVYLNTGTTSMSPYVDVVKNFFTPGVAEYRIDGTAVVRQRRTGWSSPSGVTNRSTFNTATVTVQELAERFLALYVDLSSTLGHGLIN